jgi:endonuclease/exonuclease/phosphatase family metal-dependent hydrolase
VRVLHWLLWALLATLPLATNATARESDGGRLRVMTYNVRFDLGSDGTNAWPHRRDMVAALIRHEAPDLLGLQEVLIGQKRDLEAALPKFQMIGVARDDGREKGEFSPLAFRRDRFTLVESGTIWLSETPSIPSKGWDAAFPRIATWALLRDRRSGRTLRVLNTHFDHVGVVARHQSAALLSLWLAEGAWARLPTVLMGDLNSAPDGSAYRLLAQHPASGLRDARRISRTPPYGPAGTFNAFRIDSNAAAPIDHILLSNDISVDGYSVVTQHWGGRLPSDHYPVVAELLLEDR